MSQVHHSKGAETSTGIPKVCELNATWEHKTTPWRSIYVTAILAYATNIQVSLYFSSLWPYLQILDDSVTEHFFGYVVASYSLSQIISSPALGFWSNNLKNIRVPLITCSVFSMIGDIIYILAQLIPHDRKYVIFLSRFVLGIGASSIGLLRSYVATASTKEDRTRAVAFMTGGFALGMTTGPALQLLFTPLGYPGLEIVNEFRVSMYTAPAFLGFFINVVAILVCKFCFVEVYAGLADKVEVQENGELKKVKLPDYDRVAVGICYATRFTQMFTYTNLETLGAPLAMIMFAFSKSEVVRYLAIAHAALSLIAFCVYISFVLFKLEKYINIRLHLIAALVGLILFHLVSFSWPFLPGKLTTYTNADLQNVTHELVGCNVDRLSWCLDVQPVNVFVYFVSFALFIGLCFPNINITVGTLFSHILGPRRQATQQGIMQMSGSLARLTGPIVISSLFMAFGPRLAWVLEIVVLIVTIGLWLIFYKRMIPLSSQLEDEENVENPPPLPKTSPPSTLDL